MDDHDHQLPESLLTTLPNIFTCETPRISRFFRGTDADGTPYEDWYDGTVVSYCADSAFYRVHYDDGDKEDMDLLDVLESVAYYYAPESRPRKQKRLIKDTASSHTAKTKTTTMPAIVEATPKRHRQEPTSDSSSMSTKKVKMTPTKMVSEDDNLLDVKRSSRILSRKTTAAQDAESDKDDDEDEDEDEEEVLAAKHDSDDVNEDVAKKDDDDAEDYKEKPVVKVAVKISPKKTKAGDGADKADKVAEATVAQKCAKLSVTTTVTVAAAAATTTKVNDAEQPVALDATGKNNEPMDATALSEGSKGVVASVAGDSKVSNLSVAKKSSIVAICTGVTTVSKTTAGKDAAVTESKAASPEKMTSKEQPAAATNDLASGVAASPAAVVAATKEPVVEEEEEGWIRLRTEVKSHDLPKKFQDVLRIMDEFFPDQNYYNKLYMGPTATYGGGSDLAFGKRTRDRLRRLQDEGHPGVAWHGKSQEWAPLTKHDLEAFVRVLMELAE